MFWGGETSILYVCLHVLKMFEFPCPRQFLVVSSFSKWAYWIIENMIERFHSNGSKKEEKHQTIDIVLYNAKQLSSCVRSMYLNVMLVTWIQWLIIRVEELEMATWIRFIFLSVFGLFSEITATLTHSLTQSLTQTIIWPIFIDLFSFIFSFIDCAPLFWCMSRQSHMENAGGYWRLRSFAKRRIKVKLMRTKRKREEDGKFWKWDARKCYAIFLSSNWMNNIFNEWTQIRRNTQWEAQRPMMKH